MPRALPSSFSLHLLVDRPEDQYFVELRQDLLGLFKRRRRRNTVEFTCIPVISFGLFGLDVAWYVKRRK
jgi:hypothetical protein